MTPAAPPPSPAPDPAADARDLQARLYREIGISAVAAALRFANQPDPGVTAPPTKETPAVLRDDIAA